MITPTGGNGHYPLQTIPAKVAPPAPPSPYDPPAALTPGVLNVKRHALYSDGDVRIHREMVWNPADPDNPTLMSNRLVVETGDASDTIHVRRWPGSRLQIIVNDKPYLFDAESTQGPSQGLWIKTNGGDDQVRIDDDVDIRVDVDGDDGDDHLIAGGGRTRLYGGRGNDVIQLGRGLGYAEGNDGDDVIMGGRGNNVMYGNNGHDRLYAGAGASTKQSYLDGGDGDDDLYAGNGHTVLHGGKGTDHLIGHDSTAFYTGKGQDTLWRNKADDLIYAKASDRFNLPEGAAWAAMAHSDAGDFAFSIQGEPDFQQRVADDFEFLRSSPAGQQALEHMDALAFINGNKLPIWPISFGGSEYRFYSNELDALPADAPEHLKPATNGFLQNGVPGSRGDLAEIHYDSPSILENRERTNTLVPVTALFHEMVHAYNGATGTFVRGFNHEDGHDVPHLERQTIGLPNGAQPYDFDDDPSTPAATVNPYPFTENALNAEMGKPLRQSYVLNVSPQGDGV
ncbi:MULTISPECIES: M91 family zinc metallopeptidase [Pseudomonas]|uniref:M91 family zinc metallopeptidase n=1 Tax=Pseudomonas TaxID=286 RepID=UPI001F11FE4D|nr:MULTISPECIES: M91 family zinc metallopeptidase [Pseudomonas]